MAEDMTSPARLPPSSLRFLGVLERSDPDAIRSFVPLELDESDVVWSSANATSPSSSPPGATPTPGTSVSSSSSNSAASSPSDHLRRHGRPFSHDRLGLSAVLADDGLSHVRRGATARPVPAVRMAVGRDERVFHQSAPVNVPAWPGRQRFRRDFDSLDEDGYEEEKDREEDMEEDDGEMVPPHVIVARSHVTTFSVFEGVGRTLKGRDLRRVRNAVFQKTGFLN